MYPCSHFDLNASIRSCLAEHGVAPRASWPNIGLGGKRIEAASNIIFSNGKLDPWHLGGVLKNISDSLVAIVIDDAAHHLVRSSFITIVSPLFLT